MDRILSDIQSQGYSVQDLVLDAEVLSQLKNDILSAYHNNSEFKSAGIGKKPILQSEIRGDKILWLSKETLTDAQKVIWQFLEKLKSQLNEKFFLGIKDFETHVTVYPKNTFYKKHIDQFKKKPSFDPQEKVRKVSFIIYLNSDWVPSDGGELKIYNINDQEIVSVIPRFARGVFFLSDEFPHEVLETKKERISLTGWFFS